MCSLLDVCVPNRRRVALWRENSVHSLHDTVYDEPFTTRTSLFRATGRDLLEEASTSFTYSRSAKGREVSAHQSGRDWPGKALHSPLGRRGMDSPDTVIREISSAFLTFDSGSKGYLTRHELRAVHLSLLGYEPSLLELDEILPRQPAGLAETGRMELPQLCEVMARRMCAQDVDETIRRAFRAFDPSHKGFVSRRDLLQVMSRVAPHLSERTTELIFSQVSHPSADHPTRPLPLRSRVEPRACCERLLRRSAGGENPLTLSTRGAGPACPRSPSARLPRCYCPLTGRRRF